MKLLTLITSSILALSFSCTAFASPGRDARVAALLDAGQGREAYQVLLASFEPSAAGPQDWFLLGIAAKAAGQPVVAAKAFANVIVISPASSGRSKLELAQLYYNNGSYGEARRLLLEVRAENPPLQVRQNIDRYLALMGGKGPEEDTLKFRASTSITYDSNVNQATTKDRVTMFGLPFTLSDDAKAQDDVYATLKFEMDHLYHVTEVMDWQSGLSLSRREYFAQSQYDSIAFEASTGPVFKLGKATLLSLPASIDLMKYDNKDALYSIVAGLAPQLRTKLSDKASLTLAGNIAHKHYYKNSDRDMWSYDIAPSVDFAVGQGSLRLGGSFGKDDSGVDTYSNWRAGLNVALYQPLGENLTGSLWASYAHSDYEEMEAAYTEARKDDRVSVGGDLRYALTGLGLDLIVSGSYTHNASNLDIYGYEQFQTTFTVAKPF